MAAKQKDARTQLLDKVIQVARRRAGTDAPLAEAFTRQLYRAVALEDLAERTPADLAGAALALLRLAAQRKPSELSVRIYNPMKADGWTSTHTVVEMINDDMPFLVDTITMALNKHGRSIHLTVHPIMRVKRDRKHKLVSVLPLEEAAEGAIVESVMRVEFDRQVDPAALGALETYVRKAMADVRASVTDWSAMRKRCQDIIAGLQTSPPPLALGDLAEGKRFLEWLVDNHFTFLGYREYELVSDKGEDMLKPVAGSGLGILRESAQAAKAAKVAKATKVSKSFMVLPKDVRATARAKELLIVTKANSVSTVHRPSYMDYIGIKRFNAKGEVVGEQRFLGLFTSSAYASRPEEIPLLQHKVEQVMLRSKLPPKSHGGKALLHILETFPRDELFQASTDELHDTAMGVVHLQERQRTKLFMRRDLFGRYFSFLCYVPRDRYDTDVRRAIEDLLKTAVHGVSVESQTQISESVLARLHVIVRVEPWKFPEVKTHELEQRIAQVVRGWSDELKDALIAQHGEAEGLRLMQRFGERMPEAYRADTKPKAAAYDLAKMGEIRDDASLAMSLYHPKHAPAGVLRFKVFRREQPIPISDALPMLENMGLKVISEHPYEVHLADGSIIWIQDLEMVHHEAALDLGQVCTPFQDAFAKVFTGEAENDGFNRLVLSACVHWRQVALLRALCKYLLQAGLPFSQAYMEQTLVNNADIARTLVRMFELRHDPRLKDGEKRYQAAKEQLKAALENVKSLDEDRILRAFRNVVKAILRTNYFQTVNGAPKAWMSFKLNPAKIPELPQPRPMFEIWLYSPRVEGVHLRFGKVARGGLRWSDRREDFRTEVLGLVKAQNVKNTVIVPVGSKGGFYCKRPPVGGEREAVLKEGIACYQTFLRGLLDITDNLNGAKVVPPKDVVRLDSDDPYLVVAADKGTATFSDIANGISAEYGFWLGDAFASGGSAGYDHKKMGITAKGGWESVKRHFSEMGHDTQTQDFTVVGVGDMSGDVFGNGMLLSEHIKLVAAFDHRHIFLDPNPDPARSFKERSRMFNLPRSSWADYDAKLISKGGGVFPRAAKSIPVSGDMARVLGISAGNLTPAELMRAILKAPVDLLWNGGIGTYVKAQRETNAEVGDRANDAIRINGSELRCKVIGEGGNLGMTQLGRVEYALAGGRLNTDFIDNSAGVDCSDHEVNIKILLTLAAAERKLTTAKRNVLLARMTDEVGALVLRDNYMHAFAISVAQAQAPGRISEHAHLIRGLEREGKLNRALEFLPTDEQMRERRKQGQGLTRPEIAILFAYAKMDVFNDLLDSDVPEDRYLAQELTAYFPKPLQQQYGDLMKKHRLRREIIATAITNSMVNRMGSTFAMRMTEESGRSAAEVARAYTIAREAFDMPALWAGIEALDNRISAGVQVEMLVQLSRTLRLATHWFLERPEVAKDIAAAVAQYQPALAAVAARQADLLGPEDRASYEAALKTYLAAGTPDKLARRVAGIGALFAGLDIADIARETRLEVGLATEAYYGIDQRLGLGWIRTQIEALAVDGHWQAVARGSLRDNVYAHQRRIVAAALKGLRKGPVAPALDRWCQRRDQRIQHLGRVISDMRGLGTLDFATSSVALQEISKLA